MADKILHIFSGVREELRKEPSGLQPSLWSEQECLLLLQEDEIIYNIRENYKQFALLRLRNSSNKIIFCKKGEGN